MLLEDQMARLGKAKQQGDGKWNSWTQWGDSTHEPGDDFSSHFSSQGGSHMTEGSTGLWSLLRAKLH